MNKIRKGDEVIVITGKDKGKRGVVLSVGEARSLSRVSTSSRSTSSRTR